LISERAGCVDTFVPAQGAITGWRFDPADGAGLTGLLSRVAALSPTELSVIGAHARESVAAWGPERFAQGMAEALEVAQAGRVRRAVQSKQLVN
jgi:hypothetical protein